MMSKDLKVYAKLRVKAVETYIASGSLEKVATSFDIHPRTLKRWIKRYQEQGKEYLEIIKVYKKHPKRLEPSAEKRVALLKEKKPTLTISDAKKILDMQGIRVSRKGIWSIWKRYGLAGFEKEFSLDFLEYLTVTPEILSGIKKAKDSLKKGDIKQSAQILNALPICPGVFSYERIPDRFLSLSRRAERLYTLYGKISFSEFKNKARNLRVQTEGKGLFYLSVRVGIAEALALSWLQESEKLLFLIHRLQNTLKNKRGIVGADPYLRFTLYLLEGQAHGGLFQIKDALNCTRKCKIILHSFPASLEMRHQLAYLYASIGHYRETLALLSQAALRQEPEIYTSYAISLAIAGEYRTCLTVLKKAEKKLKGLHSQMIIARAMCHFGKGEIEKALSLAQLALKESKKEGFHNLYNITTMILASGYAALKEKGKAKGFLKRPIPLLKKFRMERDLLVRQVLLGKTSRINRDEKENIIPPVRLALLLKKAQETLKIKDYRKAYNYAQSQKIMGYSHLYLLFLPESVHHILSKGKPTHLPSQFLKLPGFQKDIPAYHLTLLGPVRVYRNNNPIRARLSQKMAVFLIHICLKQGKAIPLTSLYRNFWHTSKNPARTFSHFLVRIRKYLKLSSHSLSISKGAFGEENVLHFNSHITTDYQYYEEILAQANALERAGEWMFAKKEFLRAFSLFRGEPFKKMYDPWSEHMRGMILNELETEALHFAKSCLEHDNEIRQKKRRMPKGAADAKKVLEKVLRIIPQSEESQKLLETL
jgi:transposase